MPDRVDYVIVGAGTAGCILAARLSRDPDVTVALLELGGTDSNPAIWAKDNKSMFSLWAPTAAENWGYETVVQRGLRGRAIPIPRGKVLGGCSTVNAKIYIRGNRRDFDAWRHFGNKGWSYEEVLPYFRRSETYHGPASAYHGHEGPISVVDYKEPSAVSYAFVEAAAELGAKEKYNDFNGAIQEAGAGFYQSTRTPDGARVTAASAFVTPSLKRKNLRLLTRVRATRLVFGDGRVVGVEYASQGRLESIRADREVLLCCGAFETPKLMMLSGLGPAEDMTRNDIRVVQHLPGVGQNLQDHLMLGVGFASKIPLAAPELLAEAGLFTRTSAASDNMSPDLQYFFGPVQFLAPEYMTSDPGFTFAPILAQPRSRGSVTLASGDPTALARVDMQYLNADEDIAVLEHGIHYARELAHTKPFTTLRGRELAPGKDATTTTELRDYIRRVATTVWHPCGTCKMGWDREAVVDDELRVHGVEGLRIVDASIMPKLVNGNPNAAIMMIAEKAADLIALQRSGRTRAVAGTDVASVGVSCLPKVDLGWQHQGEKGARHMPSNDEASRRAPDLKFAAAVSLRFDTPQAVGETADGIRFDFPVHGSVEGPLLNGKFPPCAAYLLIDRDGVGTINVRAPLLLNDGAVAELEATGRYDFGQDGYRRAAANDLPNSALGWCPRFLTGDPRYLWLNRALCLGVGQLRPRETRVDYDLFVVISPSLPATSSMNSGADLARKRPLYERLGGRDGIYALMSASIDSLNGNEQLNRQNPKLAAAAVRVNPTEFKNKVTDFVCRLTGGSCAYTGRTMKASHEPLDITEADWRIFVEDFVKVMNGRGVPQVDQGEMVARMETFKGDIVKPAPRSHLS